MSEGLVKWAIRNAKKTYEQSIAKCSKENPKKFYQYVNKRKPVKSDIGPIIDDKGKVSYDKAEICNTLNNYFASIFNSDLNESVPDVIPRKVFEETDKLKNIIINENDVKRYINKLKITKSPGPDEIHAIVLKELEDIIAWPITKIFNNSFESINVPLDFKLANITPIFKKGDKKIAANYRPISLTSITGKIQESILRDHIVNHLNIHNLIRGSQHGFRNNKSCLTNLLEFFDKVMNDYDEHRAVDIVYLDFRKAFDLVPHNKLISKLKSHGIEGNVLNWIKAWLSDRQQRVVINGTNSNYVNVTSGVPQGSVLGPILFLIYVNDLDDNIISNISKFADDTKLSTPAYSKDNCDALQEDLNSILNWSKKWGMKFNVDKCKSLHIGNNNINYSYKMDNDAIRKTTEQKDVYQNSRLRLEYAYLLFNKFVMKRIIS